MLPKGTITVDALADGTARIESGDMGGVAHQAADRFFEELARLCGGIVTDTKLVEGHHHHHAHDHAHDHDHLHQ